MSLSEPKTMKAPNDNVIEFDKQKVYDSIRANQKYEDDGVLLRKWEGAEEGESFTGSVERGRTKFLGIFNGKFEREGYGINYFENGDIYFGYFEKDMRNKHGVYIWNPVEENGIVKTEMYHGFWKDNKKDRHGIYIWMEEPVGNEEFEKANFEAYVGQINADNYKKGTYLTKRDESYFLYHGNFDESGVKNDEKAYFYSSTYDRLMRGKIVNDFFVDGYVSFFDSETGELNDLVYTKFNKEEVESVEMRDQINEEVREQAEVELDNFRNVILQVDYFGEMYKRYKEILKFIPQHMTTVDVFDDKEVFPEIIKICVGYNTNNIYYEIEKNALNETK